MSESKIKVVMIPADGRAPYVTNISNTLENMQRIVGGYIETCRLFTDAVMIVNEEGVLRGLSINGTALEMFNYPFVGDAFIVGVDKDEFTGLSDESAAFILKNAKSAYKRCF